MQQSLLERLSALEERLAVVEKAFDVNSSVFSDSISTLDIKVSVLQRLLVDVRLDPGPFSPTERFQQYYLEYIAVLGLIEFMLAYKKWQEAQPVAQDIVVEFGG